MQIDSINVLERAHHLILATRLEGYRHAHLTANLERRRTLFEHWTHDACAIPSRWYCHWQHRFERHADAPSRNRWWAERFGGRPEPVLQAVLERIRRHGALRARDFEPPAPAAREGQQGWWEWRPEKAALELLWRTGRLLIASRDGFEKVYDLAERVHPEEHAQPAPSREEHVAWACREALSRIGMGTAKEIAAFFHAIPIDAARIWCEAEVLAGRLIAVSVERADRKAPVRCYALPDWRRSLCPIDEERMVALCPFDPVIRERDRLARLFGFDYRFEAFTPAAKRRYGYYVLPLLEGDRFVGRIDPKFDRDADTLAVRGPWWEGGIKADRARRRRFERALDRLAASIGAGRWTLAKTKMPASGG